MAEAHDQIDSKTRNIRSRKARLPSESLIQLEAEKAASRVKIRDLRANMAQSAVNLFKEVAKYTSDPHFNLRSFLRDCGIAQEDFRAFEAFSNLLSESGEILAGGRLKFEAIKALSLVDEKSQYNALARIQSGDELSVRDIRRIQRENDAPTTFQEKVFLSSARQIKARASKATRQMLNDMRADAGQLHRAMLANAEGWAAKPNAETAKLLGVQHNHIRMAAKALLVNFERLVGGNYPLRRYWGDLALDDPGIMHLSQVHYSLHRLSRGEFKKGQFPEDQTEFYSWSSVEAIGYLAGKAPEKQGGSRIPVDNRTPVAIDISSGGGGHALGLEAAGFKVAEIYEKDNEVLSTMKANRRDWSIEKIVEFSEVGVMAGRMPRQIDLLSGAIINGAWSANGKGAEKPEELSAAIDLVLKLKPRSFIFEIDRHYRSKAHTTYRTKFEDKLIDEGYGVRRLEVSSDDFGVPQARTRAVLVGLRDGQDLLAKLQLPIPTKRAIGDLLKDVAFPDHNDRVPVLPETRDEYHQSKYNTSVASWLKDHGNEVIPDVSKLYAKIEDGSFNKSSWGKSGFNSARSDKGPLLRDPWASIPITVKTLQRIQGLPDDWKFVGSLNERIKQVSVAIPPQMIAAIAGALRKLLTSSDREDHPEWTPWIQNLPKPIKQYPPEYANRPGFRVPSKKNRMTHDRGKASEWQRYVDDQEGYWPEESGWEDIQVAPAEVKRTVPFPVRKPLRLSGQ